MANLRDIKKRISSVTTTKQITRTMEMVSTAKIRRALDRSKQAEPYKEALTDVMLTVAGDASCSGTDPMLQKHESVKHGLIVVIASDRGLAGGFNTTVERTAEFEPAFERALAAGKPSIIHVKTDAEAITSRITMSKLREQALAKQKH